MTAFLDWIDRGKQSKASPNLSEVRSVSQAYADAALRNAVRQIHEAVEGERNHTLNAVAYSIRPLIASGLLDEQFVADELAGAARMIGLGAIEIDRTIQSGFDGSDADPRPQYVLEEPQTPSLVSSIQPPPENAPEAPWKPGNDDVWGDLPPVDGPTGCLLKTRPR